MDVSRRMELDLAYCSEKVLNLEILMMQVSDIASDYEVLMKGPEELLMESIEKVFQFDILSGFLNSEVKEIESFMSSLQQDIMDGHKKLIEGDHHLEDPLLRIEENLHLAEESLKNSQDQVADIKQQSDRFEKSLAFGISKCKELENGESSQMNSKWKLQTVEQQRHFLISLEKSLAREMDFEKKLSESRYNEEELKFKLQFAEKNVYYIEDLIEEMMVKMFAAENSVEVLLGNSKECLGKLQNGHFHFSTSTAREWEEKFNMDKGLMELSAVSDPKKSKTTSFELNGFPMSSDINLGTELNERTTASSAVSILRETANDVTEKQLRDFETQSQLTEASVEEHYARLMKANVELDDEVRLLRSNGAGKANLLEKKLNESNMQLEHANASLEAIEENQRMLYTSLDDMEHLIEDLKGKVSKAENRAENAEAKCVLLTGTNFELNEELNFLRGRLESLETSLHQADKEKVATVKDIGKRTKIIIELVKKLASERERLQLQISALTNRNKFLTDKFLRSVSTVNSEKVSNTTDHGNLNSKDATLDESQSARFQVDGPISSTICETKPDHASSAEDPAPNIELVRTIDASQLNRKYILIAFILLLLSILSVFFLQPEHS